MDISQLAFSSTRKDEQDFDMTGQYMEDNLDEAQNGVPANLALGPPPPEWTRDEHERVWTNRQDCRQSRMVLPTTRHNWKGILRRDKDDVRLLTQLVTGHANLAYHRFLMNMEASPNCDCGEVQTAVHPLTECPSLVGYRIRILGTPIINAEDIWKFSFDKILRLARQTDFWNY